MVEMTMVRLHELVLVLYAVCLVFYFIDFLNKDRIAHRNAFWLLVTVFVLQTSFLILHMIETKRFPILSFFEGIYFFSWLLITISILLHLFMKVTYAVFLLNVIGFIFMTIHTFAPFRIDQSVIGEALISELMFIHVTFAIMSYAAFAMSFVFAILYLLLYRLLKEKKWTQQFQRLPSLNQTMLGMKAAIYTGTPLLLVSLILGTQWAYVALNEWSVFDFKIISSFFLLIVYSSIIYLQKMGKLIANDFAWSSIFSFLLVIVNFFLGTTLSEFHFWN